MVPLLIIISHYIPLYPIKNTIIFQYMESHIQYIRWLTTNQSASYPTAPSNLSRHLQEVWAGTPRTSRDGKIWTLVTGWKDLIGNQRMFLLPNLKPPLKKKKRLGLWFNFIHDGLIHDFPRCSEVETSGFFLGGMSNCQRGRIKCLSCTNKTYINQSHNLYPKHPQTSPNIPKNRPTQRSCSRFPSEFPGCFFTPGPPLGGSQKKSAPLEIPLTIIFPANSMYPRCSMYGIFAYIWAMFKG